jgi:hypothetical protein
MSGSENGSRLKGAKMPIMVDWSIEDLKTYLEDSEKVCQSLEEQVNAPGYGSALTERDRAICRANFLGQAEGRRKILSQLKKLL